MRPVRHASDSYHVTSVRHASDSYHVTSVRHAAGVPSWRMRPVMLPASRHGACVRLLSRDGRPVMAHASRHAAGYVPPVLYPVMRYRTGAFSHIIPRGTMPRKCVRIALYEGKQDRTYNHIPYPVSPHTAQIEQKTTGSSTLQCCCLLSLHTKKAGITPAPVMVV